MRVTISDSVDVLLGDCRATLALLPDRSVQCVITSPPYFGLRDYGTATWDGGDMACDHEAARIKTRFDYDLDQKQASNTGSDVRRYGEHCPCGARRIDAQIGLEALHDCLAWARQEPPCSVCYVCTLRTVFAEVKRVLRDDGVVFLNLSDSYFSMTGQTGRNDGGRPQKGRGWAEYDITRVSLPRTKSLLKPKDLIGIPWRVALALQADGYYLRSDIVWSKGSPMPESVMDRPTRSHEYIFMLTKRARYYYDAEAIKEPAVKGSANAGARNYRIDAIGNQRIEAGQSVQHMESGRNKRSVWHINTVGYSGAHFAVYPEKLIEPMVLAGSSPRACEHCGAPWARVVDREPMVIRNGPKAGFYGSRTTDGLSGTMLEPARSVTKGWAPTCACANNTGSASCVILDPFGGSGTTARVAIRHGRKAILCELSDAYVDLIRTRVSGVQVSMLGYIFDGE